MTTESERLAQYDAFRDYLFVVASGYVPTHEVAKAYELATATLQAERDEAVALVREMDKDKTHNATLNEKVRAFLTKVSNG